MKSFMSAALQETADATECNSCNGGAVRTTGQESVQASEPGKEQPATPEQKDAPVVVMQGPLGTAITEALNKSLSKKSLQAPVQIGGTAATESFAINHIQANGQINDVPNFIARISKSVGLVPAVDDEPTVVNTIIDAISKVDDVEFLMVGKVETDPSAPRMPEKTLIHVTQSDGTPSLEEYAVESVQVIVNYRQRKG